MGPLILAGFGIICLIGAGAWYFVIADRVAESKPELDTPSPNFVVLPPPHRYLLVWDPPKNLQIITKPELVEGETNPNSTRLPCFRFKNIGQSTAENITVEWDAPLATALEEAIKSASRLETYSPTIDGNLMTFIYQTESKKNTWSVRYDKTAISNFPFLAPTIDNTNYSSLCTPSEVWAVVEGLIVSMLPENTGAMLEFPLDIVVRWEEPQHAEQRFLATVRAMNAKPTGTGKVMMDFEGEWREPPEVLVSLSFLVSKVRE